MPSRELTKLVEKLNKDHAVAGSDKPVVMFGDEVPKIERIPTSSLALGYVLGGGWPKGRLVEVFGKEHSGKTTLTFQALRDCFDEAKGKRVVGFVDLEHRFNREWAELVGLEVDENLLVVHPPDAETASDVMRDMAMSSMFCAIAFDSVGAAMGRKAHESFRDREHPMAATASPMTRNVNSMLPAAARFDCTIFYINQVRADMSGGHAIVTPGGHALKHGCSVRLYLRSGKDKFFERRPGHDNPVQVGFRMFFKTVKNSFGPPFREGSSDFYFTPSQYLDHVGFDQEADIAKLGLALGLIEQNKAWFEWDGTKALGREKFFAALKGDGRLGDLKAAVEQAMLTAEGPQQILDEAGPTPVGPEAPDDPEI